MKRVLVEYDEQSKAVVAKVSVEFTDADVTDPDQARMVAERIFSEAQKYALNKSLNRNR